MNTVFQFHFFAVFGKAVQIFDDDTADGVVVFGIQLRSQSIVDIVQFHAAFYQVGAFAGFYDVFGFVRIVLIADLAYDFFQQVFQGDHTHGGTVFV